MDSLITAAGRALASGDPLSALNLVALRDDPPALALRGIAMAQLGDFARARALLRRAARAFGNREALGRARCIVAEAEVALASRDFAWPGKSLEAATAALEERGDQVNATHARHLEVKRRLLIGDVDEAAHLLEKLDTKGLPAALCASHELIAATIAMRRMCAADANIALDRAERAAQNAGIAALSAEIESARTALNAPIAIVIHSGGHMRRALTLREVEALFASDCFVVDACRYAVRHQGVLIAFAKRPVLFTLLRALAQAWPHDVERTTLVAQAFRARVCEESHRARLRVEIGRLRKMLLSLAHIEATAAGFKLTLADATQVAVLARIGEEKHAAMLAFLGDGEAWSSSALALALGVGKRSVQRALEALAADGKVQSLGRGRAQRWVSTPVPEFTSHLLLPSLFRAT